LVHHDRLSQHMLSSCHFTRYKYAHYYVDRVDSGKRNALIWRSSVCSSVCPVFFPTLVGRAAHTQRDSPGGSTRRGQRAFRSEY